MKRKLDKNKIKLFLGQAVLTLGFYIASTGMLVYGFMTATTLS